MLTGRANKKDLRERIEDLLDQQGLVFDEIILAGGRSEGRLESKKKEISKIVSNHPEAKKIIFWDDMKDHLKEFSSLASELGLESKIHPIDIISKDPIC